MRTSGYINSEELARRLLGHDRRPEYGVTGMSCPSPSAPADDTAW